MGGRGRLLLDRAPTPGRRLDRSSLMKLGFVVAGALAGSLFVSQTAHAKEWFDACTVQQKDGKNAFVGGPGSKAHLHVGSDFIDDTRNPTKLGGKYSTAIKKAQLKNKCDSLDAWIKAIKSDTSQYDHPADVKACLGHFKAHIGC
jgi:hypothetical protein